VYEEEPVTAHPFLHLGDLRIDDILGEAAALYLDNCLLFIATTAVLLLPCIVIMAAIAALLVGSEQVIIDTLAINLIIAGQQTIDPVSLYYTFLTLCLALAIIVYFLVLEPIAAAALTEVITRRYTEDPASLWLVYRSIRSQLRPLVRALVWAVLRLLPLLVACAVLVGVPIAIYYLVSWFFILPIMVLDPSRASASKRSRDLVRGAWWRTCAFVLVVMAMSAGATVLLGAVAAAITYNLPGLRDPQAQANVLIVALVFVRSLVLPFQVGAVTLYYWGLTARHEGGEFDTVPAQEPDLSASEG
jgi:hypothetical protein